MLVLAGGTYATRLWCVWELITLFSFLREKDALQKIDLHLLPDGSDALSKLEMFEVKNAKCYDPNEEDRLMKVIRAVGVDRFEKNIRSLAKKIGNKKKTLINFESSFEHLA
jgi:hypothetical protein